MSFSIATAEQIVNEIFQNRPSRNGVAYTSTLLQLAARLRVQGADENTQICGLLHNIFEESTAYTPEHLAEMGCPAEVVSALQQLTHVKDQEFIDARSCELIAQAVPAEDATYQAREEEYLQYVARLKANPIASAVKTADLRIYLEDERLLKAERRELKNKFRQEKYRKALEMLER